jgi:hypothetical protein
MIPDKITLRLKPAHRGAYTLVRATGVVPTAVPLRDLRRLARGLAFWSGYPVQCVLSVGTGDLGWCGWWLDHLSVIPADHLALQMVRDERDER